MSIRQPGERTDENGSPPNPASGGLAGSSERTASARRVRPVTERARGWAARVMYLLGGRGWQAAAAVAGLIGSVAVAVASSAVGALPDNRPQSWWYGHPGAWIATPGWVHAMTLIFAGGLALMVLAWLVLGAGVRRGRWRVRWLFVLAAVWALPWFLAPVALSTDAYTYLGQGLVAHAGLGAYTHGPSAVSLPGALAHRIAGPDQHVPSPYGPLFLGIAKLIAPLAWHHVVVAMLLLRVVELAGIGLAAACLPRLARACGGSPRIAVWLGVASPLVLASGVLSGHNDGLMVGLAVAALTLTTLPNRWAWPAGIAVAAVAALVKAPAAVVVLVLALGWARRAGRWRAAAGRLGAAVGIVAVLAAAASVATGLGTQWMNTTAIRSPGSLPPSFTPINAVANALHVSGALSGDAAAHMGHLVGVGLVGLFTVAVLWRQTWLGETRAAGMILTALLLVSPVLWPWYLIWPLMLYGAVTGTRYTRVGWVALAAVALFVVKADGDPVALPGPAVNTLAAATLLLVLLGAVYTYRNLLRTPPWDARGVTSDVPARGKVSEYAE